MAQTVGIKGNLHSLTPRWNVHPDGGWEKQGGNSQAPITDTAKRDALYRAVSTMSPEENFLLILAEGQSDVVWGPGIFQLKKLLSFLARSRITSADPQELHCSFSPWLGLATRFPTPSPLPQSPQAKPVVVAKVINQVISFTFLQSPEGFTLLLLTLCCHHGATSSLQPPPRAPYPKPCKFHSKLRFLRARGHSRPAGVVCKGKETTAALFSSLWVV